MKIDFRDNNLIVFLNKKKISSIDFSNNIELEDYFKDLFFCLNDDFGYDISGSYSIEVYLDDFYGAVFDIRKNDEYIDYCDIVDMKISISKFSNFIYKVNNYIDSKFCDIYLYDGCFYLKPKSADFYDIGVIIENCDVIYGKEANDVFFYGRSINGLFID